MTWSCTSRVLSSPRHLLVLLLLLSLWPSLAWAQNQGNSPAVGVPSSLWDASLRPLDTGRLPAARDATDFNEFVEGYNTRRWYMSMDTANGYLFAGLAHGLRIFDVSNMADDPLNLNNLLDVGGIGWTRIPIRAIGEGGKFPLLDVAVPENDDGFVALAGSNRMGVSFWDSTNKGNPTLLYQRAGDVNQVRMARLGNRIYGLAANPFGGLELYDVTRAKELGVVCVVQEGDTTTCPDVFRGRIGTRTGVRFVDEEDGFVVASAGTAGGFEIWDLRNPNSPQKRLSALSGTDFSPVYGVALWQAPDPANGQLKYFLALMTSTEGRIYDVNCIVTGGACSLGNPLWSQPMSSGTVNFYVTYSKSGGTPFLYFGSDDRTSGGRQREWLMDATNPRNPVDITPKKTITVEGVVTDYWSWYYEGNPSGFKLMGPRVGKFVGPHFFRAGWSIMDIHLRGGAPVADFEWASLESDGKIYPGSPIQFTDTSVSNQERSWFFEDGSPSITMVANPVITFGSQGAKQVTLTATSDSGESVRTQTVTVLDPAPVVSSVTTNAPGNQATVCQEIKLDAQGVSGKPTLGYAWSILDAGGQVQVAEVVTGQKSAVWEPSQTLAAGSYRARVVVSNAEGTATGTTAPIAISSLDPLPNQGFPLPAPLVLAGTVQFTVDVPGATEWRWRFGDGTVTDWISDPAEGEHPTHVYDAVGTYLVTLEVRQCGVPEVGVPSAVRQVEITEIEPLKADFRPVGLFCTGFGCVADVGQAITFQDASTGADLYEYDWDDGQTETSAAPITSHTYTQAGTFRPTLTVSRGNGAETDTVESLSISVAPANPTNPNITVTGPSSGETGGSYTFRASARDCTASASGWTWTVGGGGTGSSNTSSITVSWSTAGTKNVQARNSGCSGTVGQKAITISEPGGGGGGGGGGGALNAVFSFAPQVVAAGQQVAFDGRGSQGSPTSFEWRFGDGTSATGSQVTHSYSQPGNYRVTLSVLRPGTGNGCLLGFCVDEETKTVIVVGDTGPPPPPPPSEGAVCPDDPDAFCLLGGRYKVTVEWKNQTQQGLEEGIGKPVQPSPLPGDQDTTGFFYFFDPNNTELIVKVLNGTANNQHVWVFFGSLTHVEFTLKVEDQETGNVKEYHNPQGRLSCGVPDVTAFPFAAGESPDSFRAVGFEALTFDALHQTGGGGEPPTQPTEPEEDSCPAEALCLLDGRFQVEVEFEVKNQDGEIEVRTGHPIPGNGQTGYFWFFTEDNVELVVKALDGRVVNDHFWIGFGALTKQHYVITVTDTVTGTQKLFGNDPSLEAPNEICGGLDVSAFEDGGE